MPYIVTEYKKEEKGRVLLCLNEEITLWLYAGESRKLFLKEGMELSEEQYQHILHEIIGKRAVKRAVHLLEKQDRTEHQLREKLLQNKYPEESLEDAILYVKDIIERSMEEEFFCDEKEQIRNLLEKKHFSADIADRRELGKMYRFLMRRGFHSSDISAVLKTWEEL